MCANSERPELQLPSQESLTPFYAPPEQQGPAWTQKMQN